MFLLLLVTGLLGLAALLLPIGRKRAHRCRLLEPRAALSVLALYGALGNLGVAAGLSERAAALVALFPSLALEALAVGPLFRFALRFEGRPSTPLEHLAAERARAVTEFKNGRGIVEAVRDGRSIQLIADLVEEERSSPVRVGELLRIVSVHADGERVTVSYG
ncbi:MAG TPA: hypothetical protein VFF73_07620 [Planctomycetota bacterium]|nr:hypothetical protein [Planctomycetota bacterium]